MTPTERANLIWDTTEAPAHAAAAGRVMTENAPRLTKYIMLRVVADAFSEAIAPHVPCRKGCNQCCHISVAIFEPEARILAAASGRTMTKVERGLQESAEALTESQAKYYGVPCPFLKDGECSVYEARPMACRAHHSLCDTAEQCDTRGQVIGSAPTVATLKISQDFQAATAELFMLDQVAADIREFFPG